MLLMVKVANVSLWHSRYVSMYRTEYIEKVLAEVVSGGTSRLLMFSLLPFWVIPEQGFTDK